MAGLTIRPTAPDEYRTAARAMRQAYLDGGPSDDEWQKHRASWLGQDRSISAWDGDECVGHAGSYPFDTLVPGGAWLPTCGITRVAVLPTHTRRGAMTAMMDRLLGDARAAGQVLSSLRASETTIYGRFGFGLAGSALTLDIDPQQARPVTNTAPGTFRFLAPGELLDVMPDLYRNAAHRVGAITRPEWMWNRYLEEALDPDKGHFVIVHNSPDGTCDGYAQYSTEWKESATELVNGRGVVTEIRGTTPAVELALWSFLLDIDLVIRWTMDECAVDDAIFAGAADRRAIRLTTRYDEQWFRLLDVGAALAARTFVPIAHGVTIAVDDSRFADNCGTWRIDGAGAVRVDTHVEPDLRADIAAISAAYLGSTSWWELAAAGAVDELALGAVARADTLFAVRPLAFCGSHF